MPRTYKRRRSRSTSRRRPFKRRRTMGRMGYRRRRYYKRGRSTRYPQTLRIPSQFQNKVLKKFKWVDSNNTSINIAASTFGQHRLYQINTLYSPDASNVASMPSLQELGSLYLFCKVFAVKITVRFTVTSPPQHANGNTSVLCYIAVLPYSQAISSPTTLSGWQGVRDYIVGSPRYCRYGVLNSDGNGPGSITLTKYFNIGALQGNKLEYSANTTWDQPISSVGATGDPAKIQVAAIGAVLQDGAFLSNSMQVTQTVTMTYYTKFWGAKIELS